MSGFLSEAQRILDENRKLRLEMLRMPLPEKSERFTVIADLSKTSFFRDMELPRETDLEDEWQAALLHMSYEQFVDFMAWVWNGEENEG